MTIAPWNVIAALKKWFTNNDFLKHLVLEFKLALKLNVLGIISATIEVHAKKKN